MKPTPTIRPARDRSPLRKEQGVWVLRRGGRRGKIMADFVNQVLENLRRDRDERIFGAAIAARVKRP
ncbi:MAG TPA: hypothetical protein VGL53_14650 [Bryobacteraceae bacterium]|jgi:hypothetical protein